MAYLKDTGGLCKVYTLYLLNYKAYWELLYLYPMLFYFMLAEKNKLLIAEFTTFIPKLRGLIVS
ncbi:MAG: Unknown protein [uncultured Thiotrichaceae bacterium]|uniref:Uncharacterized protein n=1 Tax=uncultured Thiotrichaceae bacterium TaxID=298394 RepID=A0A6S6UI33_9GAMM|nr:MAG: Unknown protein [uncultured Thiotrichaceae bacterium]